MDEKSPHMRFVGLHMQLYIGDKDAASDEDLLKRHKITGIVNCAKSDGIPCSFPQSIDYLEVNVPDVDHPAYKLLDLLTFTTVHAFYKKHLKRGGAVLIHCIEGKSRSSTLVLGLLMEERRKNLRDALHILHHVWPQAKPNNGFMRELIEFEIRIFGSTSLDYPAPICLESVETKKE